jgi:hypothetical protein
MVEIGRDKPQDWMIGSEGVQLSADDNANVVPQRVDAATGSNVEDVDGFGVGRNQTGMENMRMRC